MLLLIDVGEDHGYALHQGLLGRGIDLQATTVYRWLAKFERDGWVLSGWSEPIDGPRRHVYRLTQEGRAALREMTGLIAAMRDRYGTFLDAHAEAVARRRGSVVDEASAPVMRNAPTPTHEVAVEVAQVPSAQRALRPRRELLIGWLLLYLDAGATYGDDLRRAFDAQRLSPDPGAMYRMLRQLEADKWVQSRWMSPAAGPRRRFIAHRTGAPQPRRDRTADRGDPSRPRRPPGSLRARQRQPPRCKRQTTWAVSRGKALQPRGCHANGRCQQPRMGSPVGGHDQAISQSEVRNAQRD